MCALVLSFSSAAAKNLEEVAGKTKQFKEVFENELKKELDKMPKK